MNKRLGKVLIYQNNLCVIDEMEVLTYGAVRQIKVFGRECVINCGMFLRLSREKNSAAYDAI